jgi:hypothetical protein
VRGFVVAGAVGDHTDIMDTATRSRRQTACSIRPDILKTDFNPGYGIAVTISNMTICEVEMTPGCKVLIRPVPIMVDVDTLFRFKAAAEPVGTYNTPVSRR